jgi:hypothetical protein
MLFQKIQDAQALVVAGGQPHGDAMIVNVAFTLFLTTDLFPDDCRMRQARAVLDKTWTLFKVDFATAHH